MLELCRKIAAEKMAQMEAQNKHSDPEDAGLLTVGERTDGGKSGSTGTEDDLTSGAAWSGRMQKKLELWTG